MRTQLPLVIIALTSVAVFGLFMAIPSFAGQSTGSPLSLLSTSTTPTFALTAHGGHGGGHGGGAWIGSGGWYGGSGWRHGGTGFYGYSSPYSYYDSGSYYTSPDRTCVWDGYQYTCYDGSDYDY